MLFFFNCLTVVISSFSKFSVNKIQVVYALNKIFLHKVDLQFKTLNRDFNFYCDKPFFSPTLFEPDIGWQKLSVLLSNDVFFYS